MPAAQQQQQATQQAGEGVRPEQPLRLGQGPGLQPRAEQYRPAQQATQHRCGVEDATPQPGADARTSPATRHTSRLERDRARRGPTVVARIPK